MITPQQIYAALKDQLGSPMGYIEDLSSGLPDDCPIDERDLTSVTVDGIVDCCEIAEFLNKFIAATLVSNEHK